MLIVSLGGRFILMSPSLYRWQWQLEMSENNAAD